MMTVQDARVRAEKLLSTVSERAQAFTKAEGRVPAQLRRVLATQPAVAAKDTLHKAWARLSAVDVSPYVKQAQGYKDKAVEAATSRWNAFSETAAGAQIKGAHAKINDMAKRFAD